MKTIQDFELKDILPDSLTRYELIQDISKTVEPHLKIIPEISQEALILHRIDEEDETLIDLLAYQFHVDFYELADSLEVKRRLVKDSLKWHMKKGTRYAILKALENLGIDAKFHNWDEFGGEPFTFTIEATVKPEYYERNNHKQLIENIYRVVNDSKAARSTMIRLDTNITEDELFKIYYGIAIGESGYQHVYIDRAENLELRINHDIAQGISGTRIIWPLEPEKIHELRLYEGIVTTLISGFDIKVDYMQPECEYQDKIYLAEAISLGGNGRINYVFELPELSLKNEVGLLQTDSYAVRISSAPYPYELMCRDIWNLTGYPEREIESTSKISSMSVLSGHVIINAEIGE